MKMRKNIHKLGALLLSALMLLTVLSPLRAMAAETGPFLVDGAVLRRQLLHRRDHRLGGLDLVRAGALADL